MFQFQIGTIGSESAIPVFHSLGSFNSRLVRLVENADRFIPGKFIKFQFQIGTIGSDWENIPVRCLHSFNSRLVRLVVDSHVKVSIFCQFQFQIGTIGRAELVREGRGLDLVSIPDWYDW